MSSKRLKVGMINHDIYPVDILFGDLSLQGKNTGGIVKLHLLVGTATALSEQIIKGTHSQADTIRSKTYQNWEEQIQTEPQPFFVKRPLATPFLRFVRSLFI